jgi:hypothetical protein
VVQVVEHPLCKHEVQVQTSVPPKKKKEEEKKSKENETIL